MTPDALFLMDLFDMDWMIYKNETLQKTIKPDTFDKFSYSMWAIEEFYKVIDSLSNTYDPIDVDDLREILRTQMMVYDSWYGDNNKQIRYKYARDAISELYRLSGGYVNEKDF